MKNKTKYLKRLTNLALILTMLLLPFSNLLNVRAEGVTITTDNTKLLTSNNNFEYVTNTSNLYLNNVGDEDTFSAYKVLDVYYNKKTNEISYGFTENFKTFIGQLDPADDFANYTVEKYQQLTSDGDNAADYGVKTASTLNKLVSKYATYIRKQTTGSVSSVKLEQGSKPTQRIITGIEAGSYLILPDKVVGFNTVYNSDFPSFYYTALNTYGVMIANIAPYAENGTYTFKGLNDTDTYYLKQTKAPTGYRLLTEVIELNPTSLNKEVGLYNIEVTNTKMGLLPSTGGLGTIFYTLIGLMIIGLGGYEVVKYSKKQVNS